MMIGESRASSLVGQTVGIGMLARFFFVVNDYNEHFVDVDLNQLAKMVKLDTDFQPFTLVGIPVPLPISFEQTLQYFLVRQYHTAKWTDDGVVENAASSSSPAVRCRRDRRDGLLLACRARRMMPQLICMLAVV